VFHPFSVARSGIAGALFAPPAGIAGEGGGNSCESVVVTLRTMQRVERLWPRRLRWRLRGAWQWPAFAALTVLDGVVLAELPFTGDGGDLFGAILLAGFFNLIAVAVLAPLAGRALRLRRRDLPRLIASDYAGTALLVAIAALLVAGGLLHRPALADEEDDERAVAAAVHDYVLSQGPREYRAGLGAIDAIRILPDEYRACVPGRDPRRWLCLLVSTDQSPAGVTLDGDRAPNSTYRQHGGFD
jgi:hypothetical protein